MNLVLKLSRIPVFFFNHEEKDRINTSSVTAFSRISVTWSLSSGYNLCVPSEKSSWWRSHILFLLATANELVSLNPKLGDLKTCSHLGNLYLSVHHFLVILIIFICTESYQFVCNPAPHQPTFARFNWISITIHLGDWE